MTFDVLPTSSCQGCGTELAPALLCCPRCRRLVHGELLREFAAKADDARARSDASTEIQAWREALQLLPKDSGQYATIASRTDTLTREVEKAEVSGGPKKGTFWAKVLGPLGGFGLLLWKIKFLILAILGKAKFLLLGLTKGATLLSMLASFGLYWTAWGWRFAAGLVGSIYIHEMGHVAMLKRLGMKASAPMFVPGLGAFVLLQQHPTSPREDARVGLAGPWWGLGAAIVSYAVFLYSRSNFWLAIAHTGAWINLFNLLPIWQLDGGRGLNALSRMQRILLGVVVLGCWLATKEGLLILIALGFGYRILQKEDREHDWSVFTAFTVLLCSLSALIVIAR